MILQLNDVGYKYVNPYVTVEAVKNVTCTFEKGQIYALQGPSGSGKTTLLSLMAGLALPTSGEVIFDGKPTAKINLDKHRRENVAIIYQSLNLLPLLTVAENVMYPMELSGVKPGQARERARELIHSVGLTDDEFKRYPSMLSGGQQQRVAIARALGTNARVILADEPTGSLDTANGLRIMEILQNLAHNEGYCVIVVTHDMAIAESSDKVYRLVDGALDQRSA